MSKVNDNQNTRNIVLKDEETLLLDHDYDGIQELDHPLPTWWLAILYISIVFSALYVGYYMTGLGPTLRQELEVALQEIEAAKATSADSGGGGGDLTNEKILALVKSEKDVASGKGVYDGKCAACHGDKGQGLIGPNLTDDFWLHGEGKPVDIAAVIRDGVAEKGMPPWGPILSPTELVDVTAFIISIHGTQPPGAKEPQGEKRQWTSL